MLTQGHCSAGSIDKDQGLNEIFSVRRYGQAQ